MRTPLLATAAVTGWALPALSAHAPGLADALGIGRHLDAGATGVALTFDDGPHPLGTPAILAALERRRARATFFLVGEQVRRRPELAREIVAAGHGVALHGDRHRNALGLTPAALASDLDRGTATITEVTGVAPSVYRPPYGIFTPAGLLLARRRRLTPLLWSRWGRDWTRRATPESISERATGGLERGDVILLHDADFYGAAGSWRKTADALPAILDAIEGARLNPVAL